MSADRDQFRIEGDCWCPGEMSLDTVRVSGHTRECTQARKGWQANYRHLGELDRRRRADEAAGRQLREAAEAILRASRRSLPSAQPTPRLGRGADVP